MTAPIERLAVVGAGLVGASIALAARAAGVGQVRITDTDPMVRRRAAELEVADEVCEDLASTVHDAEVVIAAVPAAVVADVLSAASRAAPRDAILTDAASLKENLTLEVESRLRLDEDAGPDLEGEVQGDRGPVPHADHAPRTAAADRTGGADRAAPAAATPGGSRSGRFVGGHPMAGSERSGPDAADARLFQGATWVLTPTAATDDDVLPRLSTLLRRLGARVVALPPKRHDELVAIVSHLPQVVASVLADVAADAVEATGDAVLSVAGGGYRDTTRIAASDPALWVPILAGNRSAILDALQAYEQRLARVRAALADGDLDQVATVLARASVARRQLVGKGEIGPEVDVVVPLDDRPGQLAEATTALGEAGINVEDLAMRHATEGQRGALLLRVAAAEAQRAVQRLEAAGLAAHVEDDPASPAVGP